MLYVSTQTEARGNIIIAVEEYSEEPTLVMIKFTVGILKGGKALGEDLSTLMLNLKQLINKIWREKTTLKSWQVLVLCSIYKKGDVMDCKNYKGTSIAS